MNKFTLLLCLLGVSLFSNAQTNYRSNGTGGGAWNDPSTWQFFNGTSWVASTITTPKSSDGTIEIRSGDIVTVSANVTIDQTTVDANGWLILTSNTLKLANVANALVVNGNLMSIGGSLTVTVASNLVINNKYINSVNGGSIPIATWNTNSTCLINGVTSTTITGSLSPASGFYNFTWNCPGQSVDLSVGIKKVNGALTITNSNGYAVNMVTATVGDIVVNSGSILGAPPILTLKGNMTNNGSIVAGSGAVVFSGTSSQNIFGSISFYDLNVNNSTGVSISLGSPQVSITDKLTLTSGIFTTNNLLAVSKGSTIVRTGNSSISVSPVGGPWNLTYSGSAAFTTGSEIPPSGQLISLKTSATGVVTLNSTLSIGAGGFNQTAGQFKSGAFNVSTPTYTQSGGTFTAPSTTLNLTGDFTISGGVFVHNSGTVVFEGNIPQNLNGAKIATTNFYKLSINNGATLNGPAKLNVYSDFTNNGSFVSGSGIVNFAASINAFVSGNDAQFYDVTIAKGATTLSINTQQTITNSLKLTSGKIANNSANLSINSNATITRASGTITVSSPSGSGWAIVYTGGNKSTGLEIPSSGAVSSITVSTNLNTTVTQTQDITISNFLLIGNTINYKCAAKNLTCDSLNNAGTFNAPTSAASSGLTITRILANSGTFVNNSGTVIMGGTTSIAGTTPVFNNFTINSSGNFTSPAILTIQGNLRNDGVFNSGSGAVIFSGNSAKQILGSAKIVFNDLKVVGGSSATDLILENTSGADLKGILSFDETVQAVFDTDGTAGNRTFTLLSTSDKPTSDANIAALGASATPQLPGKITVQRYMGRSGVARFAYQVYRVISSPVDTTVSDLQSSLPVSGPFNNSSVVTINNVPDNTIDYSQSSLTRYDESVAGNVANGWTSFPSSGGDTQTTSFIKGQGYSLFIFGSDDPVLNNGNAKWQLTGKIWSGDVNLPVTYNTTPGGSGNDGWNLVGNPYPSTIDWTAIPASSRPNVNNAIYIDDYSAATPVYASWVNGRNTNGGSPYIAMGQGFWVKANAASPSLTITEAAKKPGQQTTFFRQSESENSLRITLVGDLSKDETVIYFQDNASTGFDNEYDAIKLPNRGGYMNLSSSTSGTEDFAINAIPFGNCTQTINLKVSDVKNGKYHLTFSQLETISKNMAITLEDRFRKVLVDVKEKNGYDFEVDTREPLSYGANRFKLTFSYVGTATPISDLNVNVCDVTEASIAISSSAKDSYYSVFAKNGEKVIEPTQGTGTNLTLILPSSSIVSGKNEFKIITANKFCESLTASGIISLNFEKRPNQPSITTSVSCGPGSVTLIASGAPANGYYSWYDNSGASDPLPNQSNTFKTPFLNKSKAFYVTATNYLGCEGPRLEVIALVVNLAPAAITFIDLSTLQSNYEDGNQWYFNGTKIQAANSPTLTVTKSGTYKLVVEQNSCTTSSVRDVVVDTGEYSSATINAYPNPVSNILNIELNDLSEASASIINSKGQEVGTFEFKSANGQNAAKYNFGALGSGVYLVKIMQSGKASFVRIVKD